MKVFLDACVLFPSVMREVLLGAAREGLYQPLFSARVLEEWARAAARFGEESFARTEIALLRANWKGAEVLPNKGDLDRLVLPDEDDVHVLAAAIAGSADLLITLNAKDFPRHTLTAEGLSRQDPDSFLRALLDENPEAMKRVASHTFSIACRMDNPPKDVSSLLKKARLPRLAKAFRS